MDFSIRKLNSNDYDNILVKWWKDWRQVPLPKGMLPNNGEGGLIVYDGEVPVVMGFMYITNSKIGGIEFIVSNINYKDRAKRKKALETLLIAMESVLKDSGCEYIYSSVKNKGLVEAYKKQNFLEASNNCLEMIKKIWE